MQEIFEKIIKKLIEMKQVRVEQCHEDYEIEVMTERDFAEAIEIVNEVEGETSIAEDITTTDLSISLPRVAFNRMIARMENESERDIYNEESMFINVKDAARIIWEILNDYCENINVENIDEKGR